MRRCLITGASGFLGRTVSRCLAGSYEVAGLGHAHASKGLRQVDLRDPEGVGALLNELKPEVVVHCAAYREPDFCEAHPEEAAALNTRATAFLAEALPPDCTLVYISTDYVFDGEAPPYGETDVPRPVNVYGRTKWEGEPPVLARNRGVVLRVPLLVGAAPSLAESGFLALLWSALAGGEAQALDDISLRYPTWTLDVAHAVGFLLEKKAAGLFHYSGLEGATRYALAGQMADVLGCSAAHLVPSHTASPRPARRPADSQLSPEKIRALGFEQFTPFADVVRDFQRTFNLHAGA